MVALLAIPMGIQNVVIRKVSGINVYTTFVTGSLVKFAENLSLYLFWLRDRTRRRFRRRILKVLRISPRTLPFQRTALTLGLWTAYLARRGLWRLFDPAVGAARNGCSVFIAIGDRSVRRLSSIPSTLQR